MAKAMVSIDYRKSKAGYDNCFELNFNEREIIPYKYYKNGQYGASLRFFVDVLRKADMLIEKRNMRNSYGAGCIHAISMIFRLL